MAVKRTKSAFENTRKYNNAMTGEDKKICALLYKEISLNLPEAENKIWHAHPVWFLDGNPIVGYHKLKDCIRLLSGAGRALTSRAFSRKAALAAEARYTAADQVNSKDLRRWLDKARKIQWDYKNIVKRRGALERLK